MHYCDMKNKNLDFNSNYLETTGETSRTTRDIKSFLIQGICKIY